MTSVCSVSVPAVVVAIAVPAFVVTQLGLRLGARLPAGLREGAERAAGLAFSVLGVTLLAEKLLA